MIPPYLSFVVAVSAGAVIIRISWLAVIMKVPSFCGMASLGRGPKSTRWDACSAFCFVVGCSLLKFHICFVMKALKSLNFLILQEHEKRCWSVDFNLMDPKLLASGSDDAKGICRTLCTIYCRMVPKLMSLLKWSQKKCCFICTKTAQIIISTWKTFFKQSKDKELY